MDTVLRAATVYLVLLILLRIGGKRTFAQITPFDFVLLLIIGESTQQALTGEDYSITTVVIIVVTLMLIDVSISYIKQWFPRADKWIDGAPVLLVHSGEVLTERLDMSRVSEEDILEAARKLRGLERMDQIKYAVLETDGEITIIPA
jgi:uncharacterized membrane protein YcaP (DUF421 family)